MKAKTITLVANGVGKKFGLAHAQAILIHQTKIKKFDWQIADGSNYEFNGVELNGIKSNTKSAKGKTKSMGNPTSETATK